MSNRIKSRAPRPGSGRARALHGEDLATYLSDAASTPGGHSAGLYMPGDEAELAALLAEPGPVLIIGAQSSLTGGATPFGERLVSTSRLTSLRVEEGRAWVGAGVALTTLKQQLEQHQLCYPPVPTFEGATIGGCVATNAAGAQTFKYGVTRDWVTGLRVMLACGRVLDIERGECRAQGGCFEVELAPGEVARVPAPSYAQPDVPKCSAGYHAGAELDLIDLFIGAEGTLGLILEVGLATRPRDFQTLQGFCCVSDEAGAIALAGALRRGAVECWSGEAPGPDIAAIEYLDARSLELLREDGQDKRSAVVLPGAGAVALLFQVELPESMSEDAITLAFEEALEGRGDGPIHRLCVTLEEHDALDSLELAMPGERARLEQLLALRDRVPSVVNHAVADLARDHDARIHKTAADMIVPWPRFAESLALTRSLFEARGLELAIWGHISDGNVHPNLLPRSYADVLAGREAILDLGRRVVALGGSPLAEHGVGRNPMKQSLLEMLRGAEGLAQMRATKRALDPDARLAPGVLWAGSPECYGEPKSKQD
jgi:D-lactate dehydrogenase (cytochrome)